MRKINEIIVHCSATPEGRHVTVATIRKWHKKRRFADIGYHYVIYLDGSIHDGRPVERVGAHAKGHNAHSIGVCYIGGVAKDGKTAKDTRTGEQKESLETLLRSLLKQYPSIKTISGHHDYAAKACPSFPARKEYKHLLSRKPPPLTQRQITDKLEQGLHKELNGKPAPTSPKPRETPPAAPRFGLLAGLAAFIAKLFTWRLGK